MLGTIRQAIARAALESCKSGVDSKRESFIEELTGIFGLLLPYTRPRDIESAMLTFVDKAIKLKEAMTEEPAVYRCFIVDSGQSVDESCVEISDDGCVSGVVLFCMFPGLRQIIIEDQKTQILTLVKADGELTTEIKETLVKDKSNENILETSTADST